tara:strand:- start:2888 stop:3358 length:471 start_codon:yes stop_codon:yes gene_type:complete
MVEEHIKKRYKHYKKLYKLPAFEKLDSEFELSTIEQDDLLLSDIRRKISEKIDFFCEIIESSLQPDTASIASMHECKFLEDDEKEKLYTTYKKLMLMNKSAILLGIHSTNEEEAVFINEAFKNLPELKQHILTHARKMKDTWVNHTDIQEELGYFG